MLEVSLAAVSAIIVGMGAVIGTLFWLYDGSQKKRIADLESDNHDFKSREKSNQEIANEAVDTALDIANHYFKKEGKPLIEPLVPVVPEAHSPPTPEQRQDAKIATKRATMAAIRLAMDLPPRPEPNGLNGA